MNPGVDLSPSKEPTTENGSSGDSTGPQITTSHPAGQPSLQNGHSNGSSTEVKDAATKPPQNVQVIRIISRDSEKKSIQKQMGESVEVRLVAEPCEESPGATASLVASLDNASIQSTPDQSFNSNGAVNGSTTTADISTSSESEMSKLCSSENGQLNGTSVANSSLFSSVPSADDEGDKSDTEVPDDGTEEEEEEEEENEGSDEESSDKLNVSNMRRLANTARLRSLCKLGYPEELDEFLTKAKSSCGEGEDMEWLDVATEDGWTCLHDMITHECQFSKVAEVLIRHGANVNTKDLNGDTPLHSALLYHNTDNIRILLEGGADTELVNNIGRRPIHIASDSESLQLLLDHGARVDAQDRVGNAAIHFAVLSKDRDRVDVLLKAGCDVMVRNRAGSTPLHLVAGDINIAQMLLSSKADANGLDNAENSPLHLSVRGRHKEVARTLVSSGGADPHATNANGKSPLNLAKDKEMKNILLGKEPSSAASSAPGTPSKPKDSTSNGGSSSNLSISSSLCQTPSGPAGSGSGGGSEKQPKTPTVCPQPSPVIASPSILKRKAMSENRPHVGTRLRWSEVNDYSGVEDPMECGLPSKRVKVAPIYTEPPQFSDDDEDDEDYCP